ncbi:hypothetical protein Nepgr_017697 [Nepenthes gracilis]|uniref:protein-serine/threonine phosphatase n=1 Tax=Nepenthes gracilis TaxID=150966 RepID=A0AAD3XTL3_NEPGR|nr:hypothetical protein Nepgr_017697 [Nepenthes gracilis]
MTMKTVVYHGDNLLGEVEIYPENNNTMIDNNNKEVVDVPVVREQGIRISHFSQPSERCPPLAVLHTITSSGFCFKMESKMQSQETPLFALHSTCVRDNKTAVMPLEEEELHLVAMPSRKKDAGVPCFWGFKVTTGLYDSCLVMLNLRCLAIVFDLDETLIVANTLKSFEDRIEGMYRKMSTEVDPKRIAGMTAEIKRYQEDKAILKQYAENDQVMEDGKLIRVQSEVVPALSDNHQPIVRPLIRLQDKNIVLTRINPLIRDTSVLVRLRPAWEDLRSYLTARGRKRFEVYVCTLAERDYALEMWRLLDPDSNLISTSELLDRIVCVKHGARKSLFNVFNGGICHPKMALTIDDRAMVWDEKDQPRVHVVPAFAPYYAPQAEENNAIPVLCVARNVACNVRGGFFKDFDDVLLQRIFEVSYEDDLKDVPSPPDVSNYLVSEDDASGSNGNKEPHSFDVMTECAVERRIKEAIAASTGVPSAGPSLAANLDPRLAASLQFMIAAPIAVPQPAPQGSVVPFSTKHPQSTPLARPLGHVGPVDPSLHGSPAREEGEVPESELDPDTRRRLLILQHGQDTRDHPHSELSFPVRPPVQAPIPVPVPVPVSRVQSRTSLFSAEDQMSPGQLSRAVGKEFSLASDVMHIEKQRPPPFPRKIESSIRSDRTFLQKQRLPREVPSREDRSRSNLSLPTYQSFQGEDVSSGRSSSGGKDFETESGRPSLSNKVFEIESDAPSSSNKDFETASGREVPFSETPLSALHEIAMKCGTQVEFRPGLVAGTELKFSMEVYFAGVRIGEGIGKTRREAQYQSAESSLMNLADKYLSYIKSDTSSGQGEANRVLDANENGFLSDANSYEHQPSVSEDPMSFSAIEEPTRPQEYSLDGSKKSMGSVYALKELCMTEGLDVDFKAQPLLSANSIQQDEVYVQVELDGQVLGKGAGLTYDEAKTQAADMALVSLKSMLAQFNKKRLSSPRLTQGTSSKRLKPEFPRILSSRYPKNTSPQPSALKRLELHKVILTNARSVTGPLLTLIPTNQKAFPIIRLASDGQIRVIRAASRCLPAATSARHLQLPAFNAALKGETRGCLSSKRCILFCRRWEFVISMFEKCWSISALRICLPDIELGL